MRNRDGKMERIFCETAGGGVEGKVVGRERKVRGKRRKRS